MSINDGALVLIESTRGDYPALKWYGVYQNNSGGYFVIDDTVAHWVFVQAASADEAQDRLDDLTEASGRDWCECCGERWYVGLRTTDGHDEPTLYDEPISQTTGWMKDTQVRLHAHDGRVATFTLPNSKG